MVPAPSRIPETSESSAASLGELAAVETVEGAPSATAAPVPPPVCVFEADAIEEAVTLVDERSLLAKLWYAVAGSVEGVFGLVSLVAGLAVLASIPILQFASLGYLLEVSGRIARTGRLRHGFIGLRPAARVGSLVVGTGLMLLPISFVSSMWRSAMLIDPSSRVTLGWHVALLVVTPLLLVHIVSAWYCGGKLRHFFWPLLTPVFLALWLLRRLLGSRFLLPLVQAVVGVFSPRLLKELTTVPPLGSWCPPVILWEGVRRGGIYVRARDALWDFVVSLRLPYYFWLGLRGLAGAIVWLFVPVMLIISTTNMPLEDRDAARGLGGLAGFVGSLLLAAVVLYLPFLQAHFAAENRFVAMFELGKIRALFRRAPIAFWLALLVTLAFSLPLYLLEIEAIPRETLWLSSIVFVVFMWPARFATGWAVARARRRDKPRFFLSRWGSRLAALPVVAFYVLLVYFTPYLLWNGSLGLFAQHAFLTPAPFLGL